MKTRFVNISLKVVLVGSLLWFLSMNPAMAAFCVGEFYVISIEAGDGIADVNLRDNPLANNFGNAEIFEGLANSSFIHRMMAHAFLNNTKLRVILENPAGDCVISSNGEFMGTVDHIESP